MRGAIKAHDAGYKTVRGYVVGKMGESATAIGSFASHVPSDVSAGYKSSVKEMAHAYDEMYAAKNPGAVVDFKASSVPQETIDRNTLVLKNSPHAGTNYNSMLETSREKARSMSPRSVNKTTVKASESKTLNTQRSSNAVIAKASETKSKALSKQRSVKSSYRSNGNKHSKKHGH